MKKSGKFETLALFASIILVIGASYAFAEFSLSSDGGIFFNFNDNATNVYNITINNTFANSTGNFTQVNITIPSSFVINTTFFEGSQFWTNAINYSFANSTNSTTTFSWQNSSGLIMNLTWNYFAFAARSAIPGDYNLTITLINSTTTITENLSVSINDTTAPNIQIVSPVNGANQSRNYVIFNVTVNDSGVLGTLIVRLYNSTNDLINSTSNSSSIYANFTGLSNGAYYINATINDSAGNTNNSATYRVTLDTAAPSVGSLSRSSYNATSLTMTFTKSDSGTGLNGTCIVSGTGASLSGTTITANGLTCATSYTYNVTCYDYAGNGASDSDSFSTGSCPTSAAAGTDSETTATPNSYWATTYSVTSVQFLEGFSKEIAEKNRMSFKLGTETHYVGIIQITSSKVTLNVSSTPQQATLSIGETKKFDANEDGYYDIKILINSINSTSDKTNLTIIYIYEKVVTSVGNAISNNNVKSLSSNDGSNEEKPKVLDANSGKEITATEVPSFLKNKWFAMGAVLFVFMIGGAVYFVREENPMHKRVKISEHSRGIKVH